MRSVRAFWVTVVSILLLVLCMLPTMAVAEENDISINVTFNAMEINAGEELTAEYEITGGSGEYTYLDFTWHEAKQNSGSGTPVRDPSSTGKGKTIFVPRIDGIAYISIAVQDSVGNIKEYVSEKVVVHGVKIVLEVDKEEVAIGEELTVHYQVSGGSGVYSIETQFEISVIEPEFRYYSVKQQTWTANEGTTSYAPTSGNAIGFSILVKDMETNVTYFGNTGSYIPIVGTSSEQTENDININVTFNAMEINAGEELTAEYEITGGSGEYTYLDFTWHEAKQNSGSGTPVRDPSSTGKGKTIFVPRIDGIAYISIAVQDSVGNIKEYVSEKVVVHGVKIVLEVDKEEVAIGEELTVHYQVSGGSGVYSIETQFEISVIEPEFRYYSVKQQTWTANEGTTSYAPTSGNAIGFSILVKDMETNVTYFGNTGSYIPIVETSSNKPSSANPGDADNDGVIGMNDALAILRYAANAGNTINIDGADVTGDGAVNAQDALLILQYDAGWDVTLK